MRKCYNTVMRGISVVKRLVHGPRGEGDDRGVLGFWR